MFSELHCNLLQELFYLSVLRGIIEILNGLGIIDVFKIAQLFSE